MSRVESYIKQFTETTPIFRLTGNSLILNILRRKLKGENFYKIFA